MCDTLVALGSATRDGGVLFAKNSDREPNEAHEVIVLPRTTYPEGTPLRCTYMEITQVAETYAVLLSKPFQIWGAEMGSNEFGVTIGNEAVFTRVPYEKGPALTGMDLLRLGLERARTARAALDVITSLLEEHGQGGNCGFLNPFYYHNSFLIADPQEAWLLETVGKHWAAVKVESIRSISNALTIGSTWDLASPHLVDYAIERGWCKSRAEFHFARCYSDKLVTQVSDAGSRQCRTTDLIQSRGQAKNLIAADFIRVLRDHGGQASSSLSLRQGLTGCDICMHVGFGPIRINQSTGSMVSHLTPELQTHWVTGTSAPCTSIFKPVWIDSGLPDLGPSPTGKYDPSTLWWRHEALHREVIRDYAARLPLFQAERDALEAEFILTAEKASPANVRERAAITRSRVHQAPDRTGNNFLINAAWKKFNQLAGYPERSLPSRPAGLGEVWPAYREGDVHRGSSLAFQGGRIHEEDQDRSH
jgi:secernin